MPNIDKDCTKVAPKGEFNKREFNLSDKLHICSCSHKKKITRCLHEEEVKKFIKLLKDELFQCDAVNNEEPVFDIIDKLTGKDLIWKNKIG